MYYVYVSLYVYVCVYMRTRRYAYMRRGIIPVDRAKVPAHAHLTISCVIAKSYRRSRKVYFDDDSDIDLLSNTPRERGFPYRSRVSKMEAGKVRKRRGFKFRSREKLSTHFISLRAYYFGNDALIIKDDIRRLD